jgi:hypothetical protein
MSGAKLSSDRQGNGKKSVSRNLERLIQGEAIEFLELSIAYLSDADLE